jgi:hypothetical protein
MDISSITPSSARALQPRAVGAIGDGTFKNMVAQAAARPQTPKVAADPREFIPDYAAAAAAPAAAQAAATAGKVPSEAEARIQAAQIAADANVFAPFKQNQVRPPAAAAPQVTPGRFLPIARAPNVQQGQTISSRAIAPATVETLRASARFAPGSTSVSTTAAMAAAQHAHAAETPVVMLPATEGAAPAPAPAVAPSTAKTPAWFDQATRNLDKYDALKGRANTP